MSTLSGFTSKGERGKSKYQFRDINSVYRGESLEPHQQKTALPRKHGMQSLGKVPSARRPPANLPSLKSEHSGNDPAVSLVPSGGTGWGSKPGEAGQPTSVSQSSPTGVPYPAQVSTPQTTVAPAVITTVVTGALPAVTTPPPAPPSAAARPIIPVQPPIVHGEKSWSSIMAGALEGNVHPPSFLAHQSPQFQHEFPKLSSGDGQVQATGQKGGSDTQYGPGPSLRPQTEGSWMQGGGRKTGQPSVQIPSGGVVSGTLPGPAAALGPLAHLQAQVPDSGGNRGSVPNAAQGGALGPVGPGPVPSPNSGSGSTLPGTSVLPHMSQFRPIISSFLYRNNMSNMNNMNNISAFRQNMPRPNFMYPSENRFMSPMRTTSGVDDEIIPRPIIKEEDICKMDDIARDAGWATHDDIDYNQKLAFSDDESILEDESKEVNKAYSTRDDRKSVEKELGPKSRNGIEDSKVDLEQDVDVSPTKGPSGPRTVEDEEMWHERRRQQSADVALAIERARQRKEEEEQRYQETTQGAALKLQQLEQKICKKSTLESKDPLDDSSPILAPDWDKDRESEKEREADRSSKNSESCEEKTNDIRTLQHGELSKVSFRNDARSERENRSDRDRDWENRGDRYRDGRGYSNRHDQPVFSNDFQHNLPPRFQKQQAERLQMSRAGSANAPNPPSSSTSSQGSSPAQNSSQGIGIQAIDSRWSGLASHIGASHFTIPGPVTKNGGLKGGHATHLARDTDTQNADREREPEYNDISAWDSRDRDLLARRDHHAENIDRDRLRHRDFRTYPENNKKVPSSIYDLQPDYMCSYRRSSQEYERNPDFAKNHENDEANQNDTKEVRQNRDVWDQEKDVDTKEKDVKIEPESHLAASLSFDNVEPVTVLLNKENENWIDEKSWKHNTGFSNLVWKDTESIECTQQSITTDSRVSVEPSKEEKSTPELSWGEMVSSIPPELKDDIVDQQHLEDRDMNHLVQSATIHDNNSEPQSDQKKVTQIKTTHSGSVVAVEDTIMDTKEFQTEQNSGNPSVTETTESLNSLKCPEPLLVENLPSLPNNITSKLWTDTTVSDEAALVSLILEENITSQNSEVKINDSTGTSTDPDVNKETKSVTAEKEERKRDETVFKGNVNVDVERRSEKDNRGRGHMRESMRSRHNTSSVFRSSWNQRDSRGGGRWGTGGGSGRNAQSTEWAVVSESEVSTDEVSASTESGKEDVGRNVGQHLRRGDKESRRTQRSPKHQKKTEKDDRNRDTRRNDTEKSIQNQDIRRFEKRNYESVKGSREGFAPRGEPSRRGRGSFKFRGSLSKRMDGYGPPSSKSPFGQPVDDTKLLTSESVKEKKIMDPLTGDLSKDDIGGEIITNEDKLKQKQQVLSAGIIGSGPRQHTAGNKGSGHIPPRLQRKSESERRDSSRNKGGNSSRGAPHVQNRAPHRGFGGTMQPNQNSSDMGDDCWETTSDNSEGEDRDGNLETRNGKQGFPCLPDSANSNPRTGGRANRSGASVNSTSVRVQVSDNRSNNDFAGQRGGSVQSGRPQNNRGNSHSVPRNKSTSALREEEVVESTLASQTLNDIGFSKKKTDKEKTNAFEKFDINNYPRVVVIDDQPEVSAEDGMYQLDGDSGFQEVRSKKNVKEARQQKVVEETRLARQTREKEPRKMKGSSGQIQFTQAQPQQQLQTPPLTQVSSQSVPQQQLISGSNTATTTNTGKFTIERQRQSKLPPRFAKQRMRMAAVQQQSDMNKVNHNRPFPMKDINNTVPAPTMNAWAKPITASLRPNSPDCNAVPSLTQHFASVLNTQIDPCNIDLNEQPASGASSHRSTPNGEKVNSKVVREVSDKTVLDGASPPVQTIIFENTNYKTSPADLALKCKFSNHLKSPRMDKRDRKLEDTEDTSVAFTNKPCTNIPDLVKSTEAKSDPLQMPLGFTKYEDAADMKLDFPYESEISQLTEEKGNKAIGLSRSMHIPQNVQSTISPSTAELDLKIASVKKVWENAPMSTVLEHNEDGSATSTASSFTPTFGNPVDAGLDASSFVKGVDGCGVGTADDGPSINSEVVYSPNTQLQGNPNNYNPGVQVSAVSGVKNDSASTSSNVCKVKPQQQPVMSAGPSPIGHSGPLSPPPFNSTNAQQSHLNYQPTLGGSAAQYGNISAIPSPPTVLYNSQGQGGLYGPFQIDGPPVLGGQARSHISQFPPFGLSQGIGQTSAFNQQSLYLQTPAHPPPSAAPDLYQSSMSPFRLPAPQGPFGQSQQLSNNPSTVLISSSSNSLMSATVKPSTQPIGAIGAIGTKAGGPYQQSTLPSAPQPSQLFIQYDPTQVMSQNFLQSSQMVQRPGPVQSNVVQQMPPSSSFYSGSAGGQTAFYQPASSSLPQGPAAQQLHQTQSPYGIQGYGNQSGGATPVGLQGFGSQMAQPYRNTGLPGPTFLKSGTQHSSDHGVGSNGRAQLKSPSNNQQDVLSSVFSSAPPIASPKSRNPKQQMAAQQQPGQQPSPTQQQAAHLKFGGYQSMSQSSGQLSYPGGARGQPNIAVRAGMPTPPSGFPAPIQRPVVYQQGNGPANNNMGGRHRQHNTITPRATNLAKQPGGQGYYGPHGELLNVVFTERLYVYPSYDKDLQKCKEQVKKPIAVNMKIDANDNKAESSSDSKLTDDQISVSGSATKSNTNPGLNQTADHKLPSESVKEETCASAAE